MFVVAVNHSSMWLSPLFPKLSLLLTRLPPSATALVIGVTALCLTPVPPTVATGTGSRHPAQDALRPG